MTITQTTIDTNQLLTTAKLANNYLESKKIKTEHGIKYSLVGSANSNPYFDEISLYSGSAGIIHYLIQLYNTTNDVKYLEEAEAAFPYINYRWHEAPELSLAFSPWAFTSGFSGVAYAVSELYRTTQKEVYKEFVDEIVAATIEAAEPAKEGEGSYWSGSFGIVADSGTYLFLIYAAKQFKRADWKNFVIDAGRALLNQSKPYNEGGRYFEGSQFGDEIIPGFPIGAGGVAYTLLKLYELSGDKSFLDATDGVKEFYRAIYKQEDGYVKIPHDLPNEHPVYYLGLCGGNAGVARYFYEDYLITNDESSLEEAKYLVDSIVKAGAPEIHSEGYWNTVAQCCGSASILNTFIGLWLATGQEKYLDFAKRTGEQLLGNAHYEHTGDIELVRWYEAYTRTEPDNISAPIGFYDGAAGAGSALLQLYSVINGDDVSIPRSVDDPFPSSTKLTK